MAMSMVLNYEGVDVYYDKHLVLKDVSVSIQKGDFVYLLGKSGSGKTSLIKTIYADIPIRKGKANVCGYDLNNMKKREIPYLRRKIGVVFQDFQLLPDRDVYDNLLFVMKATNWANPKKMDERIHEVLESVGLQDKHKKMPYELSGGEQQRVCIARALVNHPELILADEPTGNLDPQTSLEIVQLLKSLSEKGTAVLLSTHDILVYQKIKGRTLLCENQTIKHL
ncbi:MAG: ATP-binding cassette domain-containing protein [Bacteroidetes bacterium]|nr:MAG: ATP-binding cassette domain-containing protein [Bacteroidota bacterium]